MVFHWIMSENKSPQVSRTLCCILADLNAVFWIVSNRYAIHKSSSPCTDPLVTVPRVLVSHSLSCSTVFFLFPWQGRGTYSYFRILLILLRDPLGQESPQFWIFSFLLIIIGCSRQVEIMWSVWVSKSHRCLCVSFSRTDAELYIYHLFVLWNLNFLHNSLWITFPTQSFLLLYSFYPNLLHLLIILLMVSSPSPPNLHLLFCCGSIIISFILLNTEDKITKTKEQKIWKLQLCMSLFIKHTFTQTHR